MPQPHDHPPRAETSATGPRLTRALLGYYLAVIAVITLLPFRFVVPGQLGFVRLNIATVTPPDAGGR